MARTGLLAGILGFAFAVEATADDDTSESEGGYAALSIIDDADGDGIPDDDDNCPGVPNADQADFDFDRFGDVCDNCLTAPNPGQDDCDNDHCGNLCDCDYNQDGICSLADFGVIVRAYGRMDDLCRDHTEPVDGYVGLADFGFFVLDYLSVPGPSGTTPGTVACPL
jgi:hypothetical protein